jgi:hypothetical protein
MALGASLLCTSVSRQDRLDNISETSGRLSLYIFMSMFGQQQQCLLMIATCLVLKTEAFLLMLSSRGIKNEPDDRIGLRWRVVLRPRVIPLITWSFLERA